MPRHKPSSSHSDQGRRCFLCETCLDILQPHIPTWPGRPVQRYQRYVRAWTGPGICLRLHLIGPVHSTSTNTYQSTLIAPHPGFPPPLVSCTPFQLVPSLPSACPRNKNAQTQPMHFPVGASPSIDFPLLSLSSAPLSSPLPVTFSSPPTAKITSVEARNGHLTCPNSFALSLELIAPF